MDGKLLALRGEVTTQIARMLAAKSCSEGRLYYIENCIRFLPHKNLSQREFWQAGAELIGRGGAESDGEVISLALDCLDKVSLREAKVDLGSIAVFKKVAEQFNIKNYEFLRRAVSSKSLGEITEVTNNEVALEVLTYMIEERGGPEVIRKIAEMGVKDLWDDVHYFEDLFDVIRAYGHADKVRIDLSTLREMKYYNGMVFDVFLEGLGLPIGGGGRYDAMMREFGIDLKATGFAVSVDLIVKALNGNMNRGCKEPILSIYYSEGSRDRAIALVKTLRAKGKRCTLSPYNGEQDGILVNKVAIDLKTGKELPEGYL